MIVPRDLSAKLNVAAQKDGESRRELVESSHATARTARRGGLPHHDKQTLLRELLPG